MDASYRSYVIRVRRPLDGRGTVRLDLEDLLGGRHAALLGDEARVLAERLVAMLARGSPSAAGAHPPGNDDRRDELVERDSELPPKP
jgi:hypothetical protein